MPTYNRDEFLQGALRTVLGQTYSDLELIVIDGGSTDNTIEILESCKDSRVKYFQNDINSGVSYSRNRGVELATGNYICILDDDDRWHPEKLEKQVALMDNLNSEYATVYTGGIAVQNGVIINTYRPNKQGKIYPNILANWGMGPHSGHMIRKECFENVGGYSTNLPTGEDWELDIRLSKKYRYEYIDEPLVKRISHPGNISKQQDHYHIRSTIYRMYYEEIQKYPEIDKKFKSIESGKKAWGAIQRGDHFDAIRHYGACFFSDPSMYRLLLFFFSLLGPSVFHTSGKIRRLLLNKVYRKRQGLEYIE